MSKIIVPDEKWVELYSELSGYIEGKCYPNRQTHNEDGERTEESEEDFIDIVNSVESIMEECTNERRRSKLIFLLLPDWRLSGLFPDTRHLYNPRISDSLVHLSHTLL